MQSLFPGRREDDWSAHLPGVLRLRPLVAFLMPPPSVHRSERALFPIRMTLALTGSILFGVHLVLMPALGQMRFTWVAFGGLTLLALAALLLRRGRTSLALGIGWAVVCGYVVVLHFTFGNSIGALLFAFPIALAGYLVHAPRDWVFRLVPTTFALACWALAAGHFDPSPRIALAPIDAHILLAAHAGGALYAVFVLASHATVFREAAERSIASERDRADRLLLNVLPGPIAARLLDEPGTIADSFDEVSVLFADLVGFTALAARLPSRELVELLNRLFSQFDQLAELHGLEKIKTIGDAYMVVGGVPDPVSDPVGRTARLAIDLRAAVDHHAAESGHALALRIGIHVGPVTAGVIGKRKFSYDLWGDTVNVASRMESSGEPGRIHVSQAVEERLRGRFSLSGRRELAVKGKGPMVTWFLDPPA